MNDKTILTFHHLVFYPSLVLTCMGFLVLMSLLVDKWKDGYIYFVIPMVLSFPLLVLSTSNIKDFNNKNIEALR